jgi:hypothetical protein
VSNTDRHGAVDSTARVQTDCQIGHCRDTEWPEMERSAETRCDRCQTQVGTESERQQRVRSQARAVRGRDTAPHLHGSARRGSTRASTRGNVPTRARHRHADTNHRARDKCCDRQDTRCGLESTEERCRCEDQRDTTHEFILFTTYSRVKRAIQRPARASECQEIRVGRLRR